MLKTVKPMKLMMMVAGIAAAGCAGGADPGVAETEHALSAPLQMPFQCDQAWRGSTYSGHGYSIDWINPGGQTAGQPVIPSAPGVVIPVNPDPDGYGNFVDVDHGGGWTTRYAHLSVVYAHPGDVVDVNTTLGLVGSTGDSTGPHLHYEQRLNGAVQPATFNGLAFDYRTPQYLTSQNCGATQPACELFGCQVVDGQCAGGFCEGSGCTAQEEQNCAVFAVQCVDHQCNGGFGAGHGCTAREELNCAAFGAQCVDHQCNGGYAPGHGCTAREELNCAAFGTQCVDHQCSGGFGSGTGCTAREQLGCSAYGCGCVDHGCAGGFCPGIDCTAREQIDCSNRGLGCVAHACR